MFQDPELDPRRGPRTVPKDPQFGPGVEYSAVPSGERRSAGLSRWPESDGVADVLVGLDHLDFSHRSADVRVEAAATYVAGLGEVPAGQCFLRVRMSDCQKSICRHVVTCSQAGLAVGSEAFAAGALG